MKYTSVLCALLAGLFAQTASADPFAVSRTAQDTFDRMPRVLERRDFLDQCGGAGDRDHSHDANPRIRYCTTNNTIYVVQGFGDGPLAAYELGHVFGHAIQVQHGIADIAFREISRRRDEEDALRGMVTRQVECVAGVLTAMAGLAPADLASLPAEPFTDSHWGRQPVHNGPRVSIGTGARAEWYNIGYRAQDFAVCTVGEMSSDLIVAAQN